jgi:hypothetical protein
MNPSKVVSTMQAALKHAAAQAAAAWEMKILAGLLAHP